MSACFVRTRACGIAHHCGPYILRTYGDRGIDEYFMIELHYSNCGPIICVNLVLNGSLPENNGYAAESGVASLSQYQCIELGLSDQGPSDRDRAKGTPTERGKPIYSAVPTYALNPVGGECVTVA